MLKGVANIKNWKRDFAGQKIMFNLEEIMELDSRRNYKKIIIDSMVYGSVFCQRVFQSYIKT